MRFCAVSDYAKELLISVSTDDDAGEINTKNQLKFEEEKFNFIQYTRTHNIISLLISLGLIFCTGTLNVDQQSTDSKHPLNQFL